MYTFTYHSFFLLWTVKVRSGACIGGYMDASLDEMCMQRLKKRSYIRERTKLQSLFIFVRM